MLEILGVWIYIFLSSSGLGLVLSRWFRLSEKIEGEVLSLVGLVALTVASGYLSMFVPLGLGVLHLGLLFTSGYFLIHIAKQKSYWKTKAISWQFVVFLVCFGVYAIYKSAGPISNPDTASYHLPLIKWIETYPVIKGLANVHNRFGFNYQYFNLAAIYGFAFLKSSTIHAINGYFFVNIVALLFKMVNRFFQARDLSFIVFFTALFFFCNMSNASSSFSPDVPAAVLACAALILYLIPGEQEKPYVLVFILTTGAFLFKISYFPILLLNLSWIAHHFGNKTAGKLVWPALIFTGMLLPYLIKNYYISGYLVYPFYALDLFDVVWKVPLADVIYEKKALMDSTLGVKNMDDFGFVEKGRLWLQTIPKLNSAYKLIFLVFGLSLLLYPINLLNQWRKKEKGLDVVLHLTFAASILFWLFNAPDPRFASGFLYIFIGYNLMLVFRKFQGHFVFHLVKPAMLVLSALCLFIVMGNPLATARGNFSGGGWYFVHQAAYNSSTYQQVAIGNQLVSVSSDFCLEAPLPCTYEPIKFKFLGEKIEDGFVPQTPR